MFVDVADQLNLRQGDILRDTVFPVLSHSEVKFFVEAKSSEHSLTFRVSEKHERKAPLYFAHIPVRIGFAAVISQCCDLEPHNGHIQQPTFALARLVPIPEGIAKDESQLRHLRANSDPRLPDSGFLNMFHIPQRGALEDKEWIIDFSSVFCVPSREYPGIMSQKILQMDDDNRIRFKIRLMASFGRFTKEEQASGHPWLPAESK